MGSKSGPPHSGASNPKSMRFPRQRAAASICGPPSPLLRATVMKSATSGWRFRIMCKESAQLAPLTALCNPTPPNLRGRLARFNVSWSPRMSNSLKNTLMMAASCVAANSFVWLCGCVFFWLKPFWLKLKPFVAHAQVEVVVSFSFASLQDGASCPAKDGLQCKSPMAGCR